MAWLDPKFGTHKKQYILQTLLAGGFAFLSLLALGVVDAKASLLGIIGFSSLGSSAFIVFCSCSSITAATKHVWGGYLIGIVVGMIGFSAAQHVPLYVPNGVYPVGLYGVAALAMVVSIFLMTLLNVEHPPAAGLTLGIVIDGWSLYVVLVLVSAVLLLIALRRLLRPWLVHLM